MARAEIAAARRVVVKVGSSSLTTVEGQLDDAAIPGLVEAIAERIGVGASVVLVSSGSIAAGLTPLGMSKRPHDLAGQQAAAAVGQGLLVHRYTAEFARHDLVTAQILLTANDVIRRGHHRNAQQTFEALLGLGVVPVVNENDTVATDEIRFGDNDRLAALVAHLIHADLLVLLSDVTGLYDGPPNEAGSTLISEVNHPSELEGVRIGKAGSRIGTGGMVTKLDAARIATGAGIPVVLGAAADAAQILAGAEVGTIFRPTGHRRSRRLLWLAHATDPRGALHLDAGAVRAVVERQASLLPAGITSVTGAFVAGDPVDLVGPDGAVIGRGLVNYDAEEIPKLLGRDTRELAEEFGSAYEREVVHRDDLALI